MRAAGPAPPLPPLGPDKPYKLPAVLSTVLPNGLAVQAVRCGELPLFSVRLVVRGGRADDAPSVPGLAEVLAEALEEGTASRSSAVLYDLLQGAGGDLSAEAGGDATVVAGDGLAASAGLVIDLLADVVQHPSFPLRGVARVKALCLEDLLADEAEPSFLAWRALAREIYRAHPYGTVAPTREGLRSLSRETLHREATRRLRPERSLLVVAGNVDPEQVTRRVAAAFGGWAGKGRPPAEVAEAVSGRFERTVVLLDRPGSAQATLLAGALGVTRRDPEFWPLAVGATVLGGAFSSRLVQKLRVAKGWAYAVGASSSWAPGRGTVRAWASVRSEVAAAALADLTAEMTRIGMETPSEAEVDLARRRNAGLHLLGLETPAGVARELAEAWLGGLGPSSLAQAIPALGLVTPLGVRRAGARYFDPIRTVRIVVGDARKLRKALSSLGTVVQPGIGPGGRSRKRAS